MRIRDENQKTGHLLAFISKEKREDNFSFFFPVEGLGKFDALLKIIKGFENCSESVKEKYHFIGYSVADISRIEDIFPEIDKLWMLQFDLEEFLTEDSQFVENFAKLVIARQARKEGPMFPDIITGPMATGSNFYDRVEELKEIWENLKMGENLLLRAPRRFGKSSLLNHISKNPLPGWRICYVDLEGGKSSEDFVEHILTGLIHKEECNACLPKHLIGLEVWKESAGKKLEVVRQERKQIRESWQEYAETILASMDSVTDRSLLILDEVSFLLEDMIASNYQDKVNELMAWFHDVRKKTKKLSFILSGSEYLPTFLESFGIGGQLHDLKTVHLGLFNKEITREFIFLTLAGKKTAVRLSEIDLMLTLIGEPIPYFLQLLLDTLSRVCQEWGNLSRDQIETIYYQELLGPESKRYFETIQLQLERYNRYGERCRAGAESVLDELAVNDSVDIDHLEVIWEGATGSKDRFDVILSILQDDFYVRQENGKAFFSSKLLKDWWERHGLAGKR